MTVKSKSWPRAGSYLIPVSIGLFAMAIFIVDSITDPQIDVSVLYVIVIILSGRFCRKREVIAVGLVCIILTIISLILSATTVLATVSIANTCFSILANCGTTFLTVQAQRAREDLEEVQAELARVVRVTTVGELTAAIAHEVNQPLTGLVSSGNACLRWLTHEPPNLDAARRSVERMVADGNRAAEVISRIRALVRRSPPRKSWLSVNDIILEVLSLVGAEIQRNRITLRTELSNDVPMIRGDRIQLQQVVINLIMNAIEAMGQTGQVQRDLSISTLTNPAEDVVVAVRDSGPGLDPTALDHLFDAFYTSKPEGMGMGLAISRTIVEAHGGRIWASPNMPRGARVEFALPINGEDAP